MRLKKRHIILLIGVLIILFSPYQYMTNGENAQRLLQFGITTATFALYIILFSEGSRKSKIACVLLATITPVCYFFTKPMLIKRSLKDFIAVNEQILSKANSVLLPNEGLIMIQAEDLHRNTYTGGVLSKADSLAISNVFTETGINFIERDNEKIFYRTNGFGKESRGIYFSYSAPGLDNLKKIKASWYY